MSSSEEANGTCWDCAHAQCDLKLCLYHMLEERFALDSVSRTLPVFYEIVPDRHKHLREHMSRDANSSILNWTAHASCLV